MANTIPCPNPVCTHNFGVAELQAAALLVCPKCGFRMQGKGQAAPKLAPPQVKAKPQPTPSQAAKPVIAKPIAAASAAKVAAATPVQVKAAPPSPPPAAPPPAAQPSGEESIAEGSFFNPETSSAAGTLVRSSGPKKKPFSWTRLLIIIFSVGFAICVVVAVGLTIANYGSVNKAFRDAFSKPDDDSYIGNIKNSKLENERVYRLKLSKTEWAYDGDMAANFTGPPARDNLVTAWKNIAGYDFWFAIIVKDHGKHKPRDVEMLDVAIDKLEGMFGADMELGAKPEPAKFAGLPAQKLEFRGVIKEVPWKGECHMFFKNGIAYWLFLASPRQDIVDYFVDKLPEDHVFVVSERPGWFEHPLPTEVFVSIDKKFEVTLPKGVWNDSDPKNSEGPTCKLLAGATYRKEKNPTKNAILRVFALDKQDDVKVALKEARDHLNAIAKESNETAKVVHASEIVPGQTDIGSIEDVGPRRGRVIDLKLVIGDEKEPHRYYLLGVINEPDTSYAIVCECSWKARPIWRQEFLDVLKTVKLK